MKNSEIHKLAIDLDSAIDFENEMHLHFGDDKELMYWCDIAEEGRRIAGILLSEDAEAEPLHIDSTLGAVFSAVAARSEAGVFQALAKALGVDKFDLEMVISEWLESSSSKRNDTIGFDGLKSEITKIGQKIPNIPKLKSA